MKLELYDKNRTIFEFKIHASEIFNANKTITYRILKFSWFMIYFERTCASNMLKKFIRPVFIKPHIIISFVLNQIIGTKAQNMTYNPITDVILPSDEHKSTVFFLHGQDRRLFWKKTAQPEHLYSLAFSTSGTLQRSYMNITKNEKDLILPNVKFIFPSAEKRRFTLHKGNKERIWYDINCIGCNQTEDLVSMEMSIQSLLKLIKEETNNTGIPCNRMAIGGYGMGGKMGLHMGYRVLDQIGAVFSISGYLPPNSTVFTAIQQSHAKGEYLPDLFYGKTELLENMDDEKPEWHEETYHQLIAMGIKGMYLSANQGGAMMSESMIDELWNWLNFTLISNFEQIENRTRNCFKGLNISDFTPAELGGDSDEVQQCSDEETFSNTPTDTPITISTK